MAASGISSLSYQLLFTSAGLFFVFVFYIGFQVLVVSWERLFLQRRCFWGGYHSFLSVIDSTNWFIKGFFFGNEQLTLMQNIILESQ